MQDQDQIFCLPTNIMFFPGPFRREEFVSQASGIVSSQGVDVCGTIIAPISIIDYYHQLASGVTENQDAVISNPDWYIHGIKRTIRGLTPLIMSKQRENKPITFAIVGFPFMPGQIECLMKLWRYGCFGVRFLNQPDPQDRLWSRYRTELFIHLRKQVLDFRKIRVEPLPVDPVPA